MRNTAKKLGIVMAIACLGTAFSFAGCNNSTYKGTKLDNTPATDAEVISNGGFAVEKGDYVYFINGSTEYTDKNEYGAVEKGALMRISKTDLSAGKNSAETVVPALFVEQNHDSGIYIYGDYVYFATPTTSKNSKGEIQNSMLDFKRAKLDGSEMMKNNYFRLEKNDANYRFVEENGVVYCLYEEEGALKSYNTQTGENTVLVEGASSYIYDKTDLTNPNVYYTMGVTYDVDTDNKTNPDYNQIYTVNASATAKANEKNASYTVTGKGYTKEYTFDKDYLKKQNDEAEKGEEPYDLGDYTTYPYVNLGRLVLDGVGLNATADLQYNWAGNENAFTPDGYIYTLSTYQNGGIYFTREDVNKTSSDSENTSLYFLANGANVDVVAGNKGLTVVADNTTNASSSAIFLLENDVHSYLYVSSETLYKESKEGKIALAYKVGSPNLLKAEGKYLYYYASGTNGNNLSRIDYTGSEDDYNVLLNKEEYKPATLALVDWNSGWYEPEIFGDTVLYSNAQSFGSTSYNYIYTASFGTVAEVTAQNEAYDDVMEYIQKDTNDTDTQNAMKFYFRVPTEDTISSVKEIFADNSKLLEKFDAFVSAVEAKEYKLENEFIKFIGAQTEEDAEAIQQAFIDSIEEAEEEEEEDESLPTWAIVLIVVGSVLVVAGGVIVTIILVKKNKAKKAEEEETVNAYRKKKIDTTDDKTIDVYADDETIETETDETVEEVTETEEVLDEAVEEVAEEEEVEAVEEVEETTGTEEATDENEAE